MTIPRLNPKGPISELYHGMWVALGNFDGVHLGHQVLIRAALTHSDKVGVLTFEPNPKHFFQPDSTPNRLMRADAMDSKLNGLGVSSVFEVPFDLSIANMTDWDFIDKILRSGCKAQGVIVGADFRFGKGRMGDAESLTRLGSKEGLDVEIIETLPQNSDVPEKISSTTIRNYLREGKPKDAADLLGHVWIMEGNVIPGEKRGRTIGFPTANVDIGDMLHPKHGVYAIKARVNHTGPWLDGVANFGRTPTTGLRAPLLEAHIFDFSADIYGKWLEVAVVDYLRAELKFDSLDEMVAQMHKDCDEARHVLRIGNINLPL